MLGETLGETLTEGDTLTDGETLGDALGLTDTLGLTLGLAEGEILGLTEGKKRLGTYWARLKHLEKCLAMH